MSNPGFANVFKFDKYKPKSLPPLAFLAIAEIPGALIQKGLRREDMAHVGHQNEIPGALIQKGLRLGAFFEPFQMLAKYQVP